MAALVGTGVGLLIRRYVSNRGYDPNAEDEAVRKKTGRRLAVIRAEFEAAAANPGANPPS